MTNDLGIWIKTKLLESGMTQRELAKKIGATEGLVSYYISGRRKPGGERMLKIMEVLGDEPPKPRETARSITLRQLLYYMTEGDTIQLCFADDEWDEFTELKGNSKLLAPLMDRRIVCMGAEKSENNGQAIRVTIANEEG